MFSTSIEKLTARIEDAVDDKNYTLAAELSTALANEIERLKNGPDPVEETKKIHEQFTNLCHFGPLRTTIINENQKHRDNSRGGLWWGRNVDENTYRFFLTPETEVGGYITVTVEHVHEKPEYSAKGRS